MGFIEGVAEGVIAGLLVLVLGTLFVTRGLFRVAAWPVLVMSTVRRGATIRFSSSSILRVQDGDRFLLIVTPTRGTSVPYWGPLGGVMKFRSSSNASLREIGVQTDWLPGDDEDMRFDLRVRMRGSQFSKFMRWFWKGEGRETPTECLCRELKEELGELGEQALVDLIDGIELEVSTLRHTPLFRQDELIHYRTFYVCDLVGESASEFHRRFLELTRAGIALVSMSEIKRGAHEGVVVGGHAAFLLANGRYEHRAPSYQ
jgi:hypothetical protein